MSINRYKIVLKQLLGVIIHTTVWTIKLVFKYCKIYDEINEEIVNCLIIFFVRLIKI